MKKSIVVWMMVLAICLMGGGYWVAWASAGNVQPRAVPSLFSRLSMTPAPQPDTLVVSRKNPLNQPHVAPLNRTILDQAEVRDLYAELQRMQPPEANAVVHCPNDNGVYYDLKFMQQQKLLLEVHVSASGCRTIHAVNEKGEPVKTLGMLRETDEFNAMLAKALGLKRPV